MQGDSGKCHLILSTNEPAKTQIGESLTERTNCEKLLGVKIDSKLSFENHIKTVYKKGIFRKRPDSSYSRAGYRTAGTSRVERFVIVVEGFQSFIIITNSSI